MKVVWHVLQVYLNLINLILICLKPSADAYCQLDQVQNLHLAHQASCDVIAYLHKLLQTSLYSGGSTVRHFVSVLGLT